MESHIYDHLSGARRGPATRDMESHTYDYLSGLGRGPATRDGFKLSTINSAKTVPIKGSSSLSALKKKWIVMTVIVGVVGLIVGLALGAVGYKYLVCNSNQTIRG